MKYKYDLADEVPWTSNFFSLVCYVSLYLLQAKFAQFNIASGVEGDTVKYSSSIVPSL
jgi:hypothetical protein